MHTYANHSLYRYGSKLIEREEMTPGNVLTVRNKYVAFIYIRFCVLQTFYALLIGTFMLGYAAPNFFK